MAPIDDKVVSMSFESGKFESGVAKSILAIEALKKALDFKNAGRGMQHIGIAAKEIDLGHISKGVDNVVSKLGAMRLAAVAVFAQIASKAIATGAGLVTALTVDPAKTGFQEYSTQLNSIQTILANTQAAGVNLKQVNATLKELNDYSDRTIYNFAQMARNIGTFTAAGVDLKTATSGIKGIANLAALSGSSAEQASTAMYQLSQAISAGRVNLMDWNSVVNAGMGGTVFQRALAQTAEAMGTLKKGAVQLEGPMKNVKIAGESFRSSLSAEPGKESWLTSKVLTTTLKQFTGDLKDAELAAMGFDKAQIKAIQATAKTAMHAATEVKTLKQVLDVARETAGSGWAQTWQIVFGNFTEAKKTFTDLSTTINGFVNASSDARNKVLAHWKVLGGRVVLIAAIKQTFEALIDVVSQIKNAFQDIFPAMTGKRLFDLTMRFEEFSRAIKPSPQTLALLRQTFQGLFAILHIGVQIIGGIFTAFKRMIGVVHDNGAGILHWTADIGKLLVAFDEWLQKGNRLTRFFESLGNALGGVMKIFGAFAKSITGIFSGFSSGGFSGDMTDTSGAIEGLGKAMDKVLGIFERFMEAFSGGKNIDLTPVVDSLTESIMGLGPAIGEALSSLSFDPIMQAIRTGLFAALVFSIKGFLGKGTFSDQLGKSLGSQLGGLGGGLLKSINSTFAALTSNLVAMQQNIKAKTLKEIAIAVAILAAAVIALSFVDPKKLASSLGAMATAFAELIAAMALLVVATKSGGFVKLPLITASLIGLAIAIDLLTLSVIALSLLSWEQLAKGLAGVAAMLAIISAAVIPLSAGSGGMVRAGLALIPLAIGLRILASVVGTFADMEWSEMARGFAGIGAGLAIIAAAMHLMPKSTLLIGAGLVVVAGSLKLLANVVMDFADMEWSQMGKGLAGIAAALGIIAVAMKLMPKSTIIIAVGLIGLVAALHGIEKLIKGFAGMSVQELARGIGGLALSLGVLAIALHAMAGTALGAGALGIAATSLALLVPSILVLGRLSWGKIVKGLAVLAATLAVLGIAGALVTPAIPGLLGLGVAMVLIGAGFAGIGAGLFLIASAFGILVTTLPMGLGIMIAAFNELMAALPEMTKNFILAMLEIVQMISIVAPEFVEGILKIIEDIVALLAKAAPTVAKAFGAILDLAVRIIGDNAPKIIQAGMDLLVALLNGIKNNIAMVTVAVVGIIVRFLGALTGKIGDIVRAGLGLLKALLKGIADHIADVAVTAGTIILKFIGAIVLGLGKIATAGLSILTKLLKAITENIGDVIRVATDVIVAFVKGIGDAGVRIVKAAREAAGKFINTLADEIVKLADDVFTALITLINGMATTINERAPELQTAGKNLGWAIINGMTLGLAGKAKDLYDKIGGIMGKAKSLMRLPWQSKSPSKVTMELGKNIMDGMTIGMEKNAKGTYEAATAASNGVINAFKSTLQIASPSKVMIELGKAVGEGFAVGIRGSAEDIKNAFKEMNEKLTDQMATSREIIASEQEKLDKLRAAKKPDAAAIKEAQAVIKENETLLARSTAGHILLTKTLRSEKSELLSLVKDYEETGRTLQKVKDELTQLVQERKSALESFTSQYSARPDISEPMVEEIKNARGAIAQEQAKLDEELAKSERDPQAVAQAQAAIIAAQLAFDKLIEGKVLNAEGTAVDQLATYIQALTNQSKAISAYDATLKQLRALGIDKVTYEQLVRDGPADANFANQLLSGGKTAVAGLKTLDKSLSKNAETLALHSAGYLYDTGIKAKQGLLKGLRADENKLIEEMQNIARVMVKALKKELGIKSPSKIFAELGMLTMEGMAQGLAKGSKMVDDAAKDAMTSMQRSMLSISNAVMDNLNTNPVITPVLDLTTVRTQAGELASLTGAVPITATASYGAASIISSQQTAAQEESLAAAPGGASVIFEQNNYSPESLTEIEIYRQTKNQLSQLKSVLDIT